MIDEAKVGVACSSCRMGVALFIMMSCRKRENEGSDEESVVEVKRQKMMEEIRSSLPQTLSKTQLKKQVKLKYREKMKSEWKRQKKEKEKLKRKEIKSQLDTTSKRCLRSMSSTGASSLRIAIELGYQELMSDKDIKMLMKQCQRCYAENRRTDKPVQLYLTSFNGKCKERMDQFASGYKSWDVHIKDESFLKVFDNKDIVFLAAESPNVLTELSHDKVYIIGGLVDHNHYKGHCYDQAVAAGVSHAQLPIKEHVTLNSRAVLAVNHVFEILLGYERYQNWQKALTDVIPKRKLAEIDTDVLSTKSHETDHVTDHVTDHTTTDNLANNN